MQGLEITLFVEAMLFNELRGEQAGTRCCCSCCLDCSYSDSLCDSCSHCCSNCLREAHGSGPFYKQLPLAKLIFFFKESTFALSANAKSARIPFAASSSDINSFKSKF